MRDKSQGGLRCQVENRRFPCSVEQVARARVPLLIVFQAVAVFFATPESKTHAPRGENGRDRCFRFAPFVAPFRDTVTIPHKIRLHNALSTESRNPPTKTTSSEPHEPRRHDDVVVATLAQVFRGLSVSGSFFLTKTRFSGMPFRRKLLTKVFEYFRWSAEFF